MKVRILSAHRKLLTLLLSAMLVLQAGLPLNGVVRAAPPEGEGAPGWAQEQLAELQKLGIIQGYTDGSYRPGQPVTRAEFVAMLHRASGETESGEPERSNSFTDVASGQWFAADVNWALGIGIVAGYPDNTFRPDQPVRRRESAVMLNLLLQPAPAADLPYRDKDQIPNWAAAAIAALTNAGLMAGFPDGTFGGDRLLTRAEAAVLIYHLWTSIHNDDNGGASGESGASDGGSDNGGSSGGTDVNGGGSNNGGTSGGTGDHGDGGSGDDAGDGAGGGSATPPVADIVAPAIPTGLAAAVDDSAIGLSWSANSDADLAGYQVYVSADGGVTWQPGQDAGLLTAYMVGSLTNGTNYTFAIASYDTSGNESAKSAVLTAQPKAKEQPQSGASEDLGGAAAVVSAIGPSPFAASTAFLYTGSSAIQAGLQPDTIEEARAAVLRGQVLDAGGEPLPDVTISIPGHDEYGHTTSRDNGMFDLAVNGGGSMTVQYAKSGYMTVQRKVAVPWNDYTVLPEVVLRAFDRQVTEIKLTDAADYQTAVGSTVTDEDGSRQAMLMFKPGTTATMTLPDGTAQPLSEIHVRATEYTVGENGPASMPGELPSYVGYTYAVELSADEAVAAGATNVAFNQPLYFYLDNFLQFPTGEVVPMGFYDREAGKWIASNNGKVIKIVGGDGGAAAIDADGDGAADDEAALAAIGMTQEERIKLAGMYPQGRSLWRVPVDHFTPWDANWPYGPPEDAEYPPDRPNPEPKKKNDDCHQAGSVIGCQNQSLGEVIPVAGTSLSLHYQSDREPGYQEKSTLRIPVSGETLPASLRSVEVIIQIAGRVFTKEFPATPGLTYDFHWDGKDAYGRLLTGAYTYAVTVNNKYKMQYYAARSDRDKSFGALTAGAPTATSSVIGYRQASLDMSRSWSGLLESGTNPYGESGIAGWSFNVQHTMDFSRHLLLKGDGTMQAVAETDGTFPLADANLNEFYYSGTDGFLDDCAGKEGNCWSVGHPDGTPVLGAAGEVYYSIVITGSSAVNDHRVYRLDPDGTLGAVGERFGDILLQPLLALDSENNLYVANRDKNSPSGIRTINKLRSGEETWVTVVGNNTFRPESEPYIPDGTPALEAELGVVTDMEVDAAGTLYFLDNKVLYKVEPAGTITRLGSSDLGVSEGMATPDHVGRATDISISPNGDIYLLNSENNQASIRKLTTDGRIVGVAGTDRIEYDLAPGKSAKSARFDASRLTLDDRGNIYMKAIVGGTANFADYNRFFVITASGGVREYTKQGLGDTPAGRLGQTATLVGVNSDGSMVIARGNDSPWYRIDDPSGSLQHAANSYVPDQSGMLLYDIADKHTRTLNALTGAELYTFAYDGRERLISITDHGGGVLSIERDGAGNPTAIVAPGGQRTQLTVANDRLTGLTGPDGGAYSMQYSADGLLNQFTDPQGHVRQYTYDSQGYLATAENPMGGISTLSRSESGDGYSVAFTNPDGDTTLYETKQEDGQLVRRRTDPSGGVTESILQPDGSRQITYPDGTKAKLTLAPDPRWGMQVPVVQKLEITTPQGRTSTFREQREVSLTDGKDPLSMTSWKAKYDRNGDSYTVFYDKSAGMITETDAEARKTYTYLDVLGRVVKIAPPGIKPYLLTYDDQDRLARIEQGEQFIAYTYDSANRLLSETDAGGNSRTYHYDEADRLTSVTMPDVTPYELEYDANGHIARVVLPNQDVYQLIYNGLDRLSGLATEGVTGSSLIEQSYTAAGTLAQSTLASGRTITLAVDDSDRLAAMTDPDLDRIYSYSDQDATDRVSRMQTTMADGRAQNIDFTFDGPDILSASWSGGAEGQFQYLYDEASRVANIRMNVVADTTSGVGVTESVYDDGVTAVSAASYQLDVPLAWDSRSRLTQYGDFMLERDHSSGQVDRVSDGLFDISIVHDDYGRIAQKLYSLGGQPLYQEDLQYDKAGMIAGRTVASGGSSVQYMYSYDARGELLQVTTDDGAQQAVAESYDYDVNGNRISRQVQGGSEEFATYGSYNETQQVDGVNYRFDADGRLAARGADLFHYGANGELLEASIASGGETIRYTYDALGRQTVRTNGAGSTRILYGNPANPLQITATIDENEVLTTYSYNDQGILLALDRGDARYYVMADTTGTPQSIWNAQGDIVKQIVRDSFGRVLTDSAPDFPLLIGFAGGLEDAATELVRFGFRDYDLQSGRWTSRDPALFAGGQTNLYVYVNNNPVMLRDPLGLFCIGVSGYDGLGGGISVCITKDGVSGCGEVGVGFGGGVSVNPFGDLAKPGLGASIGAKLKGGPVSLEVGADYTQRYNGDCGQASPGMKLGLGPVAVDVLNPSGVDLAVADVEGTGLNTDYGVGAEVTAKVQVCGKVP